MVDLSELPDPNEIGAMGGGTTNQSLNPGYSLASKSPSEIIQIQRILAEAGMISGQVNYGIVNNATANAYNQVINSALAANTTPAQIVSQLSASNTARKLGQSAALAGSRVADAMTASGPSRAPFTARVSNPADLRRFFRQAVINATGEFKGQVDIDKMVEAYQATERNAQAAAYNAAPSGGTVEDAMSPDAFVEEALAESVPEEVQTRNVVDRAGELFGMLGSFGGMSQ